MNRFNEHAVVLMDVRGTLGGLWFLVSKTRNPLEILRQFREERKLWVKCRGFEFGIDSGDVYFVSSVVALCGLLRNGVVKLREGVPVIGTAQLT